MGDPGVGGRGCGWEGPAPRLRGRKRSAVGAVLLGVMLAGVAAGEEPAPQENARSGRWHVVVDNDTVFADGQYTSGLKIGWRSLGGDLPDWLERAAQPLAVLSGPGAIRQWGVAVGQSIYTPDSILICPPDPADRPYAAWLYGGLGVAAHTADRLTALEVQAGVVGPSALGRQVQNTWHRVVGEPAACGWGSQLRDEPGVNVVVSHLRRFQMSLGGGAGNGLAVGVIPGLTVSAGTVQTHVGAGVMARVGQGLDGDFGPPLIGPSLSGMGFADSGNRGSWHVFAALEGRVVGRDVFLDGSTFHSSPSVSKRRLVGDARVGFVVNLGRGSAAAGVAWRTREFEGQRHSTIFLSLLAALRY